MLDIILRPFSYLRINNGGLDKALADWVVPFILALSLSVLYFFSGTSQYTFVSEVVVGLLQILPGFYIAALSAIAVFNRNDIDRHMSDPALSIKSVNEDELKLTRRHFLTMTLAFLSAQSIVLVIYIGLGIPFYDLLKQLISLEWIYWIKSVYFFSIYYMFFQVVCITFLCLYYLGERLHQPDP